MVLKARLGGAVVRRALPWGWTGALWAYVQLTKPNITVLLLVTTLASMVAAGRGSPSWALVGYTLLAGGLCAGAANAFNSCLDADIDGVMRRTRHRPIPARRVARGKALAFAGTLTVVSLLLFALLVNLTSTLLAGIALIHYVAFYSGYLKRRSPQNIVIGGAAGAFPPLIGWTAVSGGIAPEALFLFLVVLFWTPPHFWALAMLLKEDYAVAGVPMLPVVAGQRETALQALLYSGALLGVSLLPSGLGLFGLLYLAATAALGLAMVGLALVLYLRPRGRWAWFLYRYSTLYLALYFLALVLDRLLL